MRIYLTYIIIGILFFTQLNVHSQEDHTDLEWFKDAKFGIFIHWGIYSVNGDGASWPVPSS